MLNVNDSLQPLTELCRPIYLYYINLYYIYSNTAAADILANM